MTKNKLIAVHTLNLVLVILLMVCAYTQHEELENLRNQSHALANLHDEDVNALIELDQFYQKKLHHKRKIKPCFVYEVSHVA